MNVLVACEFSGVVRDAFIRKGHNAISCDLIETVSPGPHVIGDVQYMLRMKWDMIIAHPPCTYLCNSGVRWLDTIKGRKFDMKIAAYFFEKLLHADCHKICVENPIPHKYALEIIGRKYDQIIQPWQFGHGETKATCLWLKGLPKLEPTNIVDGREARIHKMPPSKDRGLLRSITYQGIADAMAEQWSILK